MKIALIQRFLPSRSRGGAGHFTHGLANALARRGHEVTVFSQDPAPSDALYEVRQTGQEKSGKFGFLFFPFAAAKQDFSGFDILNPQGDDQWIPRAGRPPLARTLHGSSLAEAMHNGLGRGSILHFLMHLYFYMMELIAVLRADHVIGISKDTGRYYPKFHGVIPNGIDTALFRRTAALKEKDPVILFVGELNSRKRGRLLADIFLKSVRPAVPDAKLWMVSPEEISGPGIFWFTDVKQEELIRMYKAAWVFCLPSSYEGFGRGYAEALAAGTVAVAAPNPGAMEVLEDGKYGFIVPDEKLGETLVMLLKNQGLRRQFQERGLERAQDYGWDRVAEQYERAYSELLEEKHAGKN